MEVLEKIYLQEPTKIRTERLYDNDVEYVRTDIFIKKACEFLYKYNQRQVQKHGPKATLGCTEFTINVLDFEDYMRGE